VSGRLEMRRRQNRIKYGINYNRRLTSALIEPLDDSAPWRTAPEPRIRPFLPISLSNAFLLSTAYVLGPTIGHRILRFDTSCRIKITQKKTWKLDLLWNYKDSTYNKILQYNTEVIYISLDIFSIKALKSPFTLRTARSTCPSGNC